MIPTWKFTKCNLFEDLNLNFFLMSTCCEVSFRRTYNLKYSSHLKHLRKPLSGTCIYAYDLRLKDRVILLNFLMLDFCSATFEWSCPHEQFGAKSGK